MLDSNQRNWFCRPVSNHSTNTAYLEPHEGIAPSSQDYKSCIIATILIGQIKTPNQKQFERELV